MKLIILLIKDRFLLMMIIIKTKNPPMRTLWSWLPTTSFSISFVEVLPCFLPTLDTKWFSFSSIFLYKTSKLLDVQASLHKDVLKIKPKLLKQKSANFFCEGWIVSNLGFCEITTAEIYCKQPESAKQVSVALFQWYCICEHPNLHLIRFPFFMKYSSSDFLII